MKTPWALGGIPFFFVSTLLTGSVWAMIPGDTNQDGEVGVSDVQCVVLASMNLGAEGPDCLAKLAHGDLDCSGEINVTDVQLSTGVALGTLNQIPGMPESIDGDRDNVHDDCDINPDYFDPPQSDRDTLANLECQAEQVVKWNPQSGAWGCGSDVDTRLDESAVDGMVANNNYVDSASLAQVAFSGSFWALGDVPTELANLGLTEDGGLTYNGHAIINAEGQWAGDATGLQGTDGQPGVGVTSVEVNAAQELVVELSDGSVYTSPPLAGGTAANPGVAGGLTLHGVTVFDEPGAQTWTRPAGVSKVLVYVTGGGGGGSRALTDEQTGSVGTGAGGGGGGTIIAMFDVDSEDSIPVHVGEAGAESGLPAETGGFPGGGSNFGGYVTAGGGHGGFASTAGGRGGEPGNAVPAPPDIFVPDFILPVPGGWGESGVRVEDTPFQDESMKGGLGGASFWGGGGAGGSGDVHDYGGGMDAHAYGGGGGGGAVSKHHPAGPGKSGVVVVYEYRVGAAGLAGTANHVPKLNGDGSVSDSDIVEIDGAVGIGNSSPGTWKLSVHGDGGAAGHVATFRSEEDRSYVSIAAGSKQHYLYTGQDGSFGVHVPGVGDKLTLYADGTAHLSGGVAISSDATLKKDVETIPGALHKVRELRGVRYHWRADSSDPSEQLGVVAQEVERVLPDLVRTDPKSGLKAVKVGQLSGLFIEAFKEQQALIEGQQQRIGALEARLKALEAE